MTDICLFAGTTEGRKLAQFLKNQEVRITVCVATEYGSSVLPESDKIRLINQRLSAEEMQILFKSEQFDLVIDATHPYAEQATENIITACSQTNTPYKRLIRRESEIQNGMVIVPDIAEAVKYLEKTTGNILLTTGSKEISAFSALPNFRERVFARVLPMNASLDSCFNAGLKPSHIIAMQGPFSEDMNRIMLKMVNAEWLVTKDSGDVGGFSSKVSAAALENVRPVVIGRPPQIEGLNESEMIDYLCMEYNFTIKPSVKIVGIGPGSRNTMTLDTIHTVDNADCLIGARRMLESFSGSAATTFEAISEKDISDYIHSHHEYSSYAVLMSGDTSFFSGTKRLLPLLSDCEVDVLPGVSSLSYLCAKLNITSEDIQTISLHGRVHNIVRDVRRQKFTFVLTGGENSVNNICRQLNENGLGYLHIFVGERLSYPDEKITKGTASDLLNSIFSPLSVILIENDDPDLVITHGLPDTAFLRDSGKKGLIPMTKNETRSVCLSKMQLSESALCWDIGAGTGAVSIEMAIQANRGHVYAIEKDESAAELIETNAKRLAVENLTVIMGTAPQICADLPTPSHVFIGGSSGNLRDIINHLASRRSPIRIIAVAVSLNTVAELMEITETIPLQNTEVVMIQTANGKKAGKYELMLGGNPVYIFSMNLSGEE